MISTVGNFHFFHNSSLLSNWMTGSVASRILNRWNGDSSATTSEGIPHSRCSTSSSVSCPIRAAATAVSCTPLHSVIVDGNVRSAF